MSATASKARLLQEISDMQTMSSRIAAQACHLPPDLRDDVLVDLLNALIVSTGGTIAVSARGDETTINVALEVTSLRVTESVAAMTKSIKEGALGIPGWTS